MLAAVPGNYQLFVHIDGHGQRLNGDHEPVEGLYPVRFWQQGDVIIDSQTLSTPVNFRPGSYTMFLGFYSGPTRLKVPGSDDDRLAAGQLPVR
ncbi:MAG: hypothetical protein IPJ88_09700 [Myxococcales bacterium]|nr:MAG: hypothetical protein IPJ88_09700 [Myxococcales bacterium]